MMRVVKIGGRAQSDPFLTTTLREAWDTEPGELCVVHGGGDEMSAMQRALGREAAFVGGRRVTSEGDLELLRMVLSGVVNKRLVNALVAAGLPAVGISGEDGALIGAELIDAVSLGFAGQPVLVKAGLLRTLLKARYLPVISPVGYNASSPKGGPLNVNGDDAAAAIAVASRASFSASSRWPIAAGSPAAHSATPRRRRSAGRSAGVAGSARARRRSIGRRAGKHRQ